MKLVFALAELERRIGSGNWTNVLRRHQNLLVAVGYAIAFLASLFYVWVLIVLLWHFGKDVLSYNTKEIDNSIKYLGSTLAIPAALWAVFVAIQQLLISRENQFTSLFGKSIEQLGTPLAIDTEQQGQQVQRATFDVRIAGIYGLERVALDSKRDHWPIMEILCRYVRQNHRAGNIPPNTAITTIDELESLPEPPLDLEAAMTAIGRRSRAKIGLEAELRDQSLREIRARRQALDDRRRENDAFDDDVFNQVDDSFRLKFDGSNLCKLNLSRCDFSFASFRGCDMRRIVFWRCNLSDAKFDNSALSGAIFFDCCLDRATFGKNDMSHAQFSRVTLRETRFYEAVNVSDMLVFDTDLEEADKILRPKWNYDYVFNLTEIGNRGGGNS